MTLYRLSGIFVASVVFMVSGILLGDSEIFFTAGGFFSGACFYAFLSRND